MPPIRVMVYPLPPLIFLAVVGWTLLYAVIDRPAEAGFAGLVIVSGALFCWVSVRLGRAIAKAPAGQ